MTNKGGQPGLISANHERPSYARAGSRVSRIA
jgi:hypothetical protein